MISCSERNELIMDWSSVVNHPCKIMFTSWEKGVQWSGESDGVTEEYDRFANPGIPLAMISDDPDAYPWLESIPARLLPHLLEFEQLWPDLLFPAMWFLSRYPGSSELLMSSPLLVALLLQSAKAAGWDESTTAELLSAPKSQIVAACDAYINKADGQPVQQLTFKQSRSNEFKLLGKSQDRSADQQAGDLHYLDSILLRWRNFLPNYATSPNL